MGMLSSYISANAIPSKVITNGEIMGQVKNHRLKPIHIQLNPTNKCPLNCSFCSCKNRDKGAEYSWEGLVEAMDVFINQGTKAVTISGGGEPLSYPWINDCIAYLRKHDVEVGLVTNAILFHKLSPKIIPDLTWCRISLSDENIRVLRQLSDLLRPGCDWAFSYVLTKKFKEENVFKALEFANDRSFTHVRIVDDILDESQENDNMSDLREAVKTRGLNDDIVVYQGRKQYTKGHKKCLFSLLRPVVDATGLIIPCCGAQYAKNPPSLDFDETMVMGSISDMNEIWSSQTYFDGSVCSKCYYGDYNDMLNMVWEHMSLKHKFFV